MMLLYAIITGVSIGIIYDAINTIRIANEIRKWREQSFEYNGGRYNKDFFELTNGKLVRKQ